MSRRIVQSFFAKARGTSPNRTSPTSLSSSPTSPSRGYNPFALSVHQRFSSQQGNGPVILRSLSGSRYCPQCGGSIYCTCIAAFDDDRDDEKRKKDHLDVGDFGNLLYPTCRRPSEVHELINCCTDICL